MLRFGDENTRANSYPEELTSLSLEITKYGLLIPAQHNVLNGVKLALSLNLASSLLTFTLSSLMTIFPYELEPFFFSFIKSPTNVYLFAPIILPIVVSIFPM